MIPCRMSQMRPVAKRYNLYTFSLFPLKVLLFILKHIFKLRKRRPIFRRCPRGWLANDRPPGDAKLAKAPDPRD